MFFSFSSKAPLSLSLLWRHEEKAMVAQEAEKSTSSLASAFFIQKKRGKAPLAALFFPSSSSFLSSDDDASLDDVKNDIDDANDFDGNDDGRGRRFVDVACKGNFCFPEEGATTTTTTTKNLLDASKTDDDDATWSSSSKSFTFGLTDQDGKRHFGFVLRYRRQKALTTKANAEEEESEESEERAMCIVSSRRYYGLFEEILRAALSSALTSTTDDIEEESRALAQSELGRFLRATLGAPVRNAAIDGRCREENVLVVPSPNAEPSLRLRVPAEEENEDLACFDAFLYGPSDDEEEEEEEEEEEGMKVTKNSKNIQNGTNRTAADKEEEEEEEEARINDRKYGKRNIVPSDAIVALLVALLFERRVVLTSKSLSKLSRATHAANRMVFPLKWQHVFLPLMPAELMDYLTAPMPFVVGLPTQLMSAYEKVPKEEVFLLNLDDGSYTYFAEDFELVPKRIANKLQKTLESERELGRREHRRRRRKLRQDHSKVTMRGTANIATSSSATIRTTTMEEVVSKAFRSFLSSAIGSYPRFVKSIALEKPPPEAISNEGLWLDQDAFVEGAPNHRTRLLRVSLRHTQMYEVFVRDRLRECANAARSGKAQFGSDVKDKDLDGESAFVAFGSEFQKEAKHVYRETQRIAKVSAIGMKKGAKLVKEKFSTHLDAFKERRQRSKTTNLSSSSLEAAADGIPEGDLEWKRIDKATIASTTAAQTPAVEEQQFQQETSSSEDDGVDDDNDDEEDNAATSSAKNRAYELKCASERAAKRQQNNNDAISDETSNNLIDLFDDIALGPSPSITTRTSSTSAAAPPSISLLDL